MAWVNYTYNSDMDNMRSGILHALEVLEAVKNATQSENINADIVSLLIIYIYTLKLVGKNYLLRCK